MAYAGFAKMIDVISISLWPSLFIQYKNPWRALLGAAFSQGAQLDDYFGGLLSIETSKYNQDNAELLKKLESRIENIDYSRKLSWHPNPLRMRDIIELGPYANEHFGKAPKHLYPQQQIMEFSSAVRDADRILDLADQLELALSLTKDNNIVEAIVICQAAYRIAARDKEGAACSYHPSLSDRLMMTVHTAGFEESRNPDRYRLVEDPNGDTYHFWTQALAGYVSEQLRDSEPIRQKVTETLFRFAPHLTKFFYILRGKMTPYGFHEEVDARGFQFGLALARYQMNRDHTIN